MEKTWQNVIVLLGLWAVAQQAVFSTPAEAQLSPDFYSTTCPNVFSIVQTQVQAVIDAEARLAASILRLHFHDCFVQGCDASILLDGDNLNNTEKLQTPNVDSVRGYEAIDTIKAAVESACPNVVSCADVLTLSSFYSVVNAGGPTWRVPLGRRDSLLPVADSRLTLPSLRYTNTELKNTFAAQSLGITELVALSGAHTLGLAQCISFSDRLTNFSNTGVPDPRLAEPLLSSLQALCSTGDLEVTTGLDLQTRTVFDNLYFQNILVGNGLLNTDAHLFTGANDTKDLVNLYANNQTKWFEDFAESMIKMGNLNPLTGTDGEVRQNCRVTNTVVTSNLVEQEGGLPKAHVFNPSKGVVGSFKQVIKDVMKKVFGDELEGLVENGVRR